MSKALSEALDLYRETRNELFRHENDVEALLKVLIAADNLAETVREESTVPVLEQFIKELKEYLEDGNDADSVKTFIATRYGPRSKENPRNDIIRLVAKKFPDHSQRQKAEVCGTDVSTVNRVLKGNDIGGRDRGHGGGRR